MALWGNGSTGTQPRVGCAACLLATQGSQPRAAVLRYLSATRTVLSVVRVRVLHLLEHQADFETRRTSAALVAGLGAEFDVSVNTIGQGGTFRHTAQAATSLRCRADAF